MFSKTIKNINKKNLPDRLVCNENLQVISVITVTYNRFDSLPETFASVTNQTYQNIEYIIIDGGSNDGTVNFLQENNDKISYWVSEKDNGIYDAMNKGSLAATGDWLIFMNCGDKFFAEDTLENIAKYLDDSVDVVYGGFEFILVDNYQTRVINRQPKKLIDIWREMPTCHQSILVRRELQIQYSFDTSFTWCADHNLIASLYADGYKLKEIPITIAKFDGSGGTGRDILTYTKERWRISKHIAKPLKRHTYFFQEYCKFFIWKSLILKIRDNLPPKLVLALRKYRGTF